eukprot:gnl/TRDRNA2_/TRDRNA2_90951_c0_seq1.p1 gnl/TRDRNA2_/TRDRNA2_90951_c0~~gnl/TRDRNA2_/TRDRNA2_90951_c0_seq1.p1  ORF type:complete len:730 (+),score=155.80 gnl/TRDRNA2_/TRDRNA2_90951_c0_seq1:97-2286(+)
MWVPKPPPAIQRDKATTSPEMFPAQPPPVARSVLPATPHKSPPMLSLVSSRPPPRVVPPPTNAEGEPLTAPPPPPIRPPKSSAVASPAPEAAAAEFSQAAVADGVPVPPQRPPQRPSSYSIEGGVDSFAPIFPEAHLSPEKQTGSRSLPPAPTMAPPLPPRNRWQRRAQEKAEEGQDEAWAWQMQPEQDLEPLEPAAVLSADEDSLFLRSPIGQAPLGFAGPPPGLAPPPGLELPEPTSAAPAPAATQPPAPAAAAVSAPKPPPAAAKPAAAAAAVPKPSAWKAPPADGVPTPMGTAAVAHAPQLPAVIEPPAPAWRRSPEFVAFLSGIRREAAAGRPDPPAMEPPQDNRHGEPKLNVEDNSRVEPELEAEEWPSDGQEEVAAEADHPREQEDLSKNSGDPYFEYNAVTQRPVAQNASAETATPERGRNRMCSREPETEVEPLREPSCDSLQLEESTDERPTASGPTALTPTKGGKTNKAAKKARASSQAAKPEKTKTNSASKPIVPEQAVTPQKAVAEKSEKPADKSADKGKSGKKGKAAPQKPTPAPAPAPTPTKSTTSSGSTVNWRDIAVKYRRLLYAAGVLVALIVVGLMAWRAYPDINMPIPSQIQQLPLVQKVMENRRSRFVQRRKTVVANLLEYHEKAKTLLATLADDDDLCVDIPRIKKMKMNAKSLSQTLQKAEEDEFPPWENFDIVFGRWDKLMKKTEEALEQSKDGSCPAWTPGGVTT